MFEKLLVAALAMSSVALLQVSVKARGTDTAFFAQANTAMAKMMARMASHPSGDVDRDFVATMVPHHLGAIEMAEAELRFGRNGRIRRLAQEIVVTQREEIAAMHLALADSSSPPAMQKAAPPQTALSELYAQAPFAAPGVRITHHDRVYAAEQFSNTVSVTDPAANTLLGVIRLGDPQPHNFSPLYRGQVLVHGMGFSPDHRTIAVTSIASNSVTFIDTATNVVKHTTYVGRSPHEPFFTPDGSELWVTVRGENYVSVLDTKTYREKARIVVPNGPGMATFSPDGKYGYVCSSFTPRTVIVAVRSRKIVGRLRQASPFCPNIAVTPNGRQVWFTLKDSGKVQVFDARPPFSALATIESGPISNHVNFASNARGTFAYVTVGGLNVVKVFRTNDFVRVATISVGNLPHGIWPSGDGTRVYVGLENDDRLTAIDTLANKVIATVPIGQAAQAVTYVPGAVPRGAGTQGLEPLGLAGNASHLTLAAVTRSVASTAKLPTSVALFDQGLTQILEAAVTGLKPSAAYVLAFSRRADGGGRLESLGAFETNFSGSAIVNAVGQIRQVAHPHDAAQRCYLVIAPGTPSGYGAPVQVQSS